VGLYTGDQVGEIFLRLESKEGPHQDEKSWIDAVARSVSVGLQHGVPLERYVKLYTFTKWSPCGPVKGDSRIRMCTSPLDLVFRFLAIQFLKDEEYEVKAPKLEG